MRTGMIEGMALPGALTAEPDEVARTVMAVIRALPEGVFKKTSL